MQKAQAQHQADQGQNEASNAELAEAWTEYKKHSGAHDAETVKQQERVAAHVPGAAVLLFRFSSEALERSDQKSRAQK